MAKERINLIPCVREALGEMGISTVRVTQAVNSALGECKEYDRTENLSDGKSAMKDSTYRVNFVQTIKREGKMTVPLRFDVWHGMIAKADKYATIDKVSIPVVFHEWLAKMKIEQVTTELVNA